MGEVKKNFNGTEENKMKNVNSIFSSKLERGICCQLQSEGLIDTEQLPWLLNEIKDD